jgi:hypothetical protein
MAIDKPPRSSTIIALHGHWSRTMEDCGMSARTQADDHITNDKSPDEYCRRACPVCGGPLLEIRQKLQCSRCHSIVETCCEGGRG